MKTRVITTFAVLAIIIFSFAYLFGDSYASKHPSLNIKAGWPDINLRHVNYFSNEHRYSRALYHLDKAIASVRAIEIDVDLESAHLLEKAILKLETLHQELVLDSLRKKDMHEALDLTLNTLARAELKVSEMYAETNNTDLARLAMSYAQLHLKNAMLFENSEWRKDSMHVVIEKELYIKLDSLLEDESISPVLLTNSIHDLIDEIDQLVKP